MTNNGGNREFDRRSELRPHDEFLELCAVSTSGELNEEERKSLEQHLAGCLECRQALREFQAAADVGAPLLSSELSSPSFENPISVSSGSAEASTGRSAPIENKMNQIPPVRTLVSAHRNGHGRWELNWNYVWASLAAGILLTIALGIYSYQVGERRGLEVARVIPNSAAPGVDAIERQMSDVGHEREVLNAQLAERDRVIRDLRREMGVASASLSELKAAQANLERSILSGEADKQRAAQERGTLAQKLEAAEATLVKMQNELDSVRHARSQDQLRAASLEAKIGDLTAQLRNRDETVDKQQELLAHDRDIRELMGARDLYIAEVYDVARDGATQKPYGRVFYTKGKSLIFYAYDLDQQAGIKNSSAFQAWGRRGPDRQQALNLGIFYEDSVAKKRWVLRFDDPKALGQIDAVFVTVEPNGGSHRPSGKPLLFAYLKLDPNHP
jgi:predicted  nucleic acid-binding Zn-ribbon protein